MPRNTLWLAAPLVVSLCSCTSAPRVSRMDESPRIPSLTSNSVRDESEPRVTLTSAVRGQSPDGRDPFADDDNSEGVVRLSPAPKAPKVTAAAHRGHGGRAYPNQWGFEQGRGEARFTPAEPRGPVDCPTDASSCPPGAPCGPQGPGPYATMAPYGYPRPPVPRAGFIHGAVPPVSYPQLYPDEYVCDGGDRDYPVHYDDYNRLGLDTEDTVAEFVDSDGTFRVKPSTKVCVYAPRFGAMRTVTGLQADTSIRRIAAANETTYGSSVRNRDVVQYHNQRRGVDRMLVRSRPSGLYNDEHLSGAQQATSIISHTKLINTYQDISFLRTGIFVTGEEAWLAERIQAAVAWNRNENPVIAAKIEGGQQVTARFKPMEIIGIEDKRTKGKLRIIKLADVKTAVPGDVVTFTIRYDNLGDLPLTNIRIVDNLSPRLDYVDDSATSDRAGAVTVEDNNEGSLLLTIELDDPLPGKTGGVVTFKTTVR